MDDEVDLFPHVPSISDLEAILPDSTIIDDAPPTPNEVPRATLSASFTSSVPIANLPLPAMTGGASATTGSNSPTDEYDIEALRARACQLASTPIPNYKDAFARKNKKYTTRKYRDRDLARTCTDDDPNSIRLANRTSAILSNFQEYITEIESERLDDIMSDDTGGYSPVIQARRSVDNSLVRKSEADELSPGIIGREWTYSRNDVVDGSFQRVNLHSNGVDYEEETMSARSYSKEGKYNKRRGRYWTSHPYLHSKKFKVGILWSIVAVVILGVIIGITSHTNSGEENEDITEQEKPLLDRNEDVEQQEKQHESEVDDELLPDTEVVSSTPQDGELLWDTLESSIESSEQNAEDFSSVPEENEKAAVSQSQLSHMVIGLPSNKTEPSDASPAAEEIVEEVDIESKYSPKNDGTSEVDEIDGSQGDAPFVAPEITEHDEAIYEATLTKYSPLEFNRQKGWEGKTYLEAIEFCQSLEQDTNNIQYGLCSYDAICPLGHDTQPIGGYKESAENEVWLPISDKQDEWVQISRGNACIRWTYEHQGPPEWGLAGDEDADMASHIICCISVDESDDNPADIAKTPEPTNNPTPLPDFEGGSSAAEEITQSNLNNDDALAIWAPKWYSRDESWAGKSYTDAIAFCARKDSGIPCPYQAYCPQGPGSPPFEGSRDAEVAWTPIIDTPNGWVNVGGGSDTCELYNSLHTHPPLWGLAGRYSAEEETMDDGIKDITSHIMCCREPDSGQTALSNTSTLFRVAETKHEQDILDKKHPVWFSRKHGYRGSTHQEAADFCKSVADMVLCSHDSYCPQDSEKPLFLQKDAFEGEQWAPVATTDIREEQRWIQVGKLDGDSESTCSTFGDVKAMKPPGWSVERDSEPALRDNVLCCLNPQHLLKEVDYARNLDRVWLDSDFGWKGGSHQDASELCKKLGNKKLCPYTAYCPHGPGQPVIGGHVEDFNLEGEQWAPVQHSNGNYWVQIGQKYANGATTCLDNWVLDGHEPSWGLTNERADLKRHVMCCSY